MFNQENLSQLLDILGNRNRRRIVELLREKPCFVTEISEVLSINPKAVNEHLNLMQKEDVVSSYLDDKRRKYYYLVQDFTISVQPTEPKAEPLHRIEDEKESLPLADKILMLKKLLNARERMIESLEAIESDIDRTMNQVMTAGRSVFQNKVETEILLALVHTPLTPIELADISSSSLPEVTASLRSLMNQGYIVREDGRYALKETSGTD
ncbi:MAG TPA: ArsR family transcriptional regulator [Methanocorpusculum sp.]|nr:ArsR family transcriptional regulator [Methanocorpusculum sp.]